MRYRRSTRLPGFDYLGCHRYFATCCADRRAIVFTTRAPVELVKRELLRTAAAADFAVIAYCFMPDHLHLLVEGRSDAAEFRHFMHQFKQHSAFHWKRRYRSGLWERSYFERVLRAEEDTHSVAAYIVGNPVRAGLVEDPAAYPFSGSTVLSPGDLIESVRP